MQYKFHNNIKIPAAKADSDSQNVVYILFCAKCPNAVYVGKTSNHFRIPHNNHKQNLSGYPIDKRFDRQSHILEDLRCIIKKSHI